MQATGAGIRFFWFVCIAGLVVGGLGCMTNNWTSPLMTDVSASRSSVTHKSLQESSMFGNSAREKELFATAPVANNVEGY